MEFKILLKNIRFYRYNGCIKEEGLIGTEYFIDVEIITVNKSFENDNLDQTVDYCEIYDIIKKEAENRYNLIETLAFKILNKIKNLPNVKGCTLEIKKINPPINGDVESVSVIFAA